MTSVPFLFTFHNISEVPTPRRMNNPRSIFNFGDDFGNFSNHPLVTPEPSTIPGREQRTFACKHPLNHSTLFSFFMPPMCSNCCALVISIQVWGMIVSPWYTPSIFFIIFLRSLNIWFLVLKILCTV